MEHLTEIQIAGFRGGTLPGPALLEVDGHLKQCSECRRKLLDACPDGDVADLLERMGDEHLEYQQLEAYADGGLSGVDRAGVIAHLAVCPACRAEADDLCEFRARLQPPGGRAMPWRRPAAAAAAVLFVVTGAWWWMQKPASQIPPRYTELVATALRTGRVEIAPRIAELRTSAGVLRGDPHADSFRLESPLGTALVDAAPIFRWQSAGPDARYAARYEVRVFDADLVPVVESGPLAQTEWSPGKPLPRGRTYRWQVTASVNGKTLHAPGAAAPEAKFYVLEQDAVDEIESVRRSGNSLLLGLLYARDGVVDLAERELSSYAAAHPTAQARALLANFQREVGR